MASQTAIGKPERPRYLTRYGAAVKWEAPFDGVMVAGWPVGTILRSEVVMWVGA